MGFGLAVAIFLDATIIRGVLFPASMKLLGDWNWYLPEWLEWLPKVAHEPSRKSSIRTGRPADRLGMGPFRAWVVGSAGAQTLGGRLVDV